MRMDGISKNTSCKGRNPSSITALPRLIASLIGGFLGEGIRFHNLNLEEVEMGRILLALTLLMFSFTAMASTPKQFQPYQLENSITVDDIGINHIGAGSELEVEIFQLGIVSIGGGGSGGVTASLEHSDNHLSIIATAFHLEDPGLRSHKTSTV